MPVWMNWIPDQSPVAVTIISIALMLAIGFLMTRITKLLRLPNVTAYIVGGILAGPFCLNLLPAEVVEKTSFLPDIALAFIAFSTGEFFQVSTLKKNGGKVFVITVMESCCAALLVFLVCYFVLGLNLAFSIVLGALALGCAIMVGFVLGLRSGDRQQKQPPVPVMLSFSMPLPEEMMSRTDSAALEPEAATGTQMDAEAGTGTGTGTETETEAETVSATRWRKFRRSRVFGMPSIPISSI